MDNLMGGGGAVGVGMCGGGEDVWIGWVKKIGEFLEN